MGFDWGDGEYEETAAALAPASEVVCEAAAVAPGKRVLDVGCGTGNASLAAARRGGVVTGLDPAPRLLDVARGRAARDGLGVRFVQGDAGAIPAEDASFECVLSVFAVIFATDPARAAAEMHRVLRPGGRAVLTTWTDEGAIAEASKALMATLKLITPPDAPPRAAPRWADEAFVRGLFEPLGARVAVHDRTLSFTAASPAAWFASQESKHPGWRSMRAALVAAGHDLAWEGVRAASVDALTRWNEDPAGLTVTSRYRLVTITR